MQLPWTAPGFGQGIYPSQAEFFIPKAVDPSLIAQITRSREQQQGQLQEALASIGQLFAQRRQDQIANQVMNQYQAPRAAAVNPESFDPGLAASQGLNFKPQGDSVEDFMRSSVTGPPATPAFTGGREGLAAAMQARKLQDEDITNQLNQNYKMAATQHMLGLANGGSGGGSGGHGDRVWSEKMGGWVTTNQKWNNEHPKVGAVEGAYPGARGRIATQDDVDAGRAVKAGDFTNKYPGADQGDQIRLMTKGGKPIVMPYEDYLGIKGEGAGGGASGGAVVGEVRKQNGVTYQFNGTQWIPQ